LGVTALTAGLKYEMDQTGVNEQLEDIKAMLEEIEDDVDVLAYCLSCSGVIL
jgi:hypothetical protein